jgi:hypothetical protein
MVIMSRGSCHRFGRFRRAGMAAADQEAMRASPPPSPEEKGAKMDAFDISVFFYAQR